MSRGRIIAGIIGLGALVGGGAVASAQVVEDIISIPVDSVLRAPAGSVTQVASASVPAEFQGAGCIAEVEVDNQESVHDGNDLIVSSGGTSGVVENFESEAFGVRTVEIPLTLGSTVDVSLRMGPDRISSGGVFITVDCTQAVPPTTTPAPTTPPSTEPPATEPPDGGATTTVPDTATPPTSEVAVFPPGGGTPGSPGSPSSPSPGLPATGPSNTTWMAITASVLLVAGAGLLRVVRRPS